MALETPVPASEGMLDLDEPVFICQGCGEILEEGKAFELTGKRWHIDCFRCHNCHTALNSDAHLLLLGDNSLICRNCTYTCTVCQSKIDDLAILTGEEAFCEKCFRCRNCKRQIENLKYAKTSQGIFCMQCHGSLMARRRRKAKAAGRTSSSQSIPTSRTLEKSLPALPPTNDSTPRPETLESITENLRKARSLGTERRSIPAASTDDLKENMVLPSRTYGDNISATEPDDPSPDDGFSIPVALDTTPGIPSSRPSNGTEQLSKDYFGAPNPSSPAFRTDFADLLTPRSNSRERERSRSPGSSHIAYQEKGRVSSADTVETLNRRKESGMSTPNSTIASPQIATVDRFRLSVARDLDDQPQSDKFKLQDAPKRRSSNASNRANFRSDSPVGHMASERRSSPVMDGGYEFAPGRARTPDQANVPNSRGSYKSSPLASPVNPQGQFERPLRGDSMPKPQGVPARKELPRDAELPLMSSPSALGRQESVKGKSISRPTPSNLSAGVYDALPARSPRRLPTSQTPDAEATEAQPSDFTQPRAPPPRPPPESRHRPNESISSIQSEHFQANDGASSPRRLNSATGDTFPDGYADTEEGLFRKMSKAVRHGRSQSDKIGAASPKWTAKNSRNVSVDISSPVAATSGDGEGVDLRNKLRYSQQRIAELEAEKLALQEQVNGTEDIRQVNSELRQKRSTMAVLDTQRELVVRELEVMTNHLQMAKNSNGPIIVEQLKSEVMRDFASSMERLKEELAGSIEDLLRKKNELTSEISNLIQMKDKGFQEYESLSSKNQQLNEHNNQLVHSIQDLYRQGRQPGAPAYASNGLGIYSHHKDKSDASVDARESSYTQWSGDTEVEPATVLSAPQVVSIRKGQPKKFINWKKGRDTVGKNISKSLKGAFSSTQNSSLREESFAEGVPYSNIPADVPPTTGTAPLAPSRSGNEQGRQAWNFLSTDKSRGGSAASGQNMPQLRSNNSGSTVTTLPVVVPSGDSTLFGSDLTARCEFEKTVVPAIVMNCIDQVSQRGIDQEGVYRKSGSSIQVKAMQAGFEKDYAGYNISDPDIDIHAITGCLKQYFRKLPNPLITFEAYDSVLDAVKPENPEDAKISALRDAVRTLPKCHNETLHLLCHHLVSVMEQSSVNLMTSLNLAVVFAPTIMRPQSIEREISDSTSQRTAVQCMLENFNAIFDHDAEADT